MNKTVIRGITSVNSKFFHIALVDCHNFKGSKIKISAPASSPNTDGIHVERSSNVYFSRSRIGTGDDCISIGQGNSQVIITSIHCGPGHGIRYLFQPFFMQYITEINIDQPVSLMFISIFDYDSVGSLGKYRNEGDVSGLMVKDCTMTETMNGVRIKTWPNSPGSSAATNMTFKNIIMNNVTNPIIIDQSYCPFMSCNSKVIKQIAMVTLHTLNSFGSFCSSRSI